MAAGSSARNLKCLLPGWPRGPVFYGNSVWSQIRGRSFPSSRGRWQALVRAMLPSACGNRSGSVSLAAGPCFERNILVGGEAALVQMWLCELPWLTSQAHPSLMGGDPVFCGHWCQAQMEILMCGFDPYLLTWFCYPRPWPRMAVGRRGSVHAPSGLWCSARP